VEITYEEARGADVTKEAVAILNDTRRDGEFDQRRCGWLYLDNPAGPASIWLARSGGEVAGFAALIPRWIDVDGTRLVAWITADLSVRDAFRRRGIATALRGKAREGVDRGAASLLYGNPNCISEGVHRKVGFTCLGALCRHAKILSSASYVARLVPSAALSRVIGSALDPLVRRLDGEHRSRNGLSVRRISDQAFDRRFDDLFASTPRSRSVIGVRDAAYLAWRYGQNPLDEHLVWIAESGADLAGYLVARRYGPALELLDLYPLAQPAVAEELLAALFAEGRARGLSSVSASLLEGHPFEATLAGLGFRLRDSHSHVFAYVSPTSPHKPVVERGASWAAMDGDRDV
jgi:GNAT superfamily N-acetyltransferase